LVRGPVPDLRHKNPLLQYLRPVSAMFISRRAIMGRVLLEGDNTVFGPSHIGDDSTLGRGVIIGYPCRSSLKRGLDRSKIKTFDPEIYDRISEGARLGDASTVRSGTVIYERVLTGKNLETGHNVLIREDTSIGDNSRIGSSTVIDGAVNIGCRVVIQSGAYLPPKTIVEDDVFIAPCVTITNDQYPPSRRLIGVTIKRGAVIGASAILIPGITVGEEAVVAAGALVTCDVSPKTVVMGMPARPKMKIEEYRRKKQEYEDRC